MGEKETWDEAKKGEEKGGKEERTSGSMDDEASSGGGLAEATTVKGSKSNTSERAGQGGPPGQGEPLEAANLNLSKSNINRTTEPGDDDSGAADDRTQGDSAKKMKDSVIQNIR